MLYLLSGRVRFFNTGDAAVVVGEEKKKKGCSIYRFVSDRNGCILHWLNCLRRFNGRARARDKYGREGEQCIVESF